MKRSRISGKVLAEIRHRDAGELVHSKARKESLVGFEDADHFVRAAIEPHRFADRVDGGKEGIRDGAPDHDDIERMLLVVCRDEAARGDCEEREHVDIRRLYAAQEESAPRARRRSESRPSAR